MATLINFSVMLTTSVFSYGTIQFCKRLVKYLQTPVLPTSEMMYKKFRPRMSKE